MKRHRRNIYLLGIGIGFLALSVLPNPARELVANLLSMHGLVEFLHLAEALEDLKHGSRDFVISQSSTRLKTQHEEIVLVYISNATVEGYPYVSPIDRGLLASVIQRADAAGAKVIGLDVLLDRKTETKKDDALIAAIRHAGTRIVLGAVYETRPNELPQAKFFFTRAEGDPEVGHLYLGEEPRPTLKVRENVVRLMVDYPKKSFAEVLAHSFDVTISERGPWLAWLLTPSRYIDWILPPNSGADTFMTLAAEDVLNPSKAGLTAKQVNELLKGKIVLIGGNFDDRDQHLIPLSASGDELYSGLYIQAQILAQLLGNRLIYEVNWPTQVFLVLLAVFGGYWLGRRGGYLYHLLDFLGVVGLIVVWFFFFWWARVIFPYNLMLIAWLAGAAAGHYWEDKSPEASLTPEVTR